MPDRPSTIQIDPDDQPEQGSMGLGQRLLWWARRAIVIGVAGSLLVHLLLYLLAGHIWFGFGSPERPEPAPVMVEFAYAPELDLASVPEGELELDTPEVPDTPSEDLPADLLDSLTQDEIPGLPEDAGQLKAPLGLGGGDISSGSDLDAGGSGGGAASFFGVEAEGNRFAFVVDISGSMAFSGKIEATARELLRSINELSESSSFYIVFYNSTAHPLTGADTTWTDATDSGKRWARNKMAEVRVGGGTDPVPAFEAVSRLKPKPDAIYFMTDGEFVDEERTARDILSLDRKPRIPIHCITFVSKDSEKIMKRIALVTEGSYTHVPGPGGSP